MRTKDAAFQCSLPYTHTEPITKDASVQSSQPLLIHEHCNYPSDSELVDTERTTVMLWIHQALHSHQEAPLRKYIVY